MSLQPQSQEQNKLENKSTNEGDMEEENGGQKGRREETEETVNNTLLLLSSRIKITTVYSLIKGENKGPGPRFYSEISQPIGLIRLYIYSVHCSVL